MLELVGELSALSGSAIRDALASPDAPLAGRGRGDPRGARRRPRLGLAARGRPARADRARRRRRRRRSSSCPSTFGVLGAALADPASVVEAEPERPPLGHEPAGPRGRLRDPRRRRAVGRPARSSGADPTRSTESERELHPRRRDRRRQHRPRGRRPPPTSPTSSSAPTPCGASPSDIGSRLDLDEILERLVDHAQRPVRGGPGRGIPVRGGRHAPDGRVARPVARPGSTP